MQAVNSRVPETPPQLTETMSSVGMPFPPTAGTQMFQLGTPVHAAPPQFPMPTVMSPEAVEQAFPASMRLAPPPPQFPMPTMMSPEAVEQAFPVGMRLAPPPLPPPRATEFNQELVMPTDMMEMLRHATQEERRTFMEGLAHRNRQRSPAPASRQPSMPGIGANPQPEKNPEKNPEKSTLDQDGRPFPSEREASNLSTRTPSSKAAGNLKITGAQADFPTLGTIRFPTWPL